MIECGFVLCVLVYSGFYGSYLVFGVYFKGFFWGRVGCSVSLMSRVLGRGCGFFIGFSFFKYFYVRLLRLVEFFLAFVVVFRVFVYVVFFFLVGSVGVSNYIYFYKFELCFI